MFLPARLSAAARAAADFSGIVVLFMTMVGVIDVAGRYLFNKPLASAFELIQFSMVLTVFGGLAWCGIVGRHVTINMLESSLAKPGGRWIKFAVHLAGATLFAAVLWKSSEAAVDYYLTGETSNMLKIPLYPFFVAIALGAALYAATLFVAAVKALNPSNGDSA